MRTFSDTVSEWFSFKTKAQREKEARSYAAWAFPGGDKQRELVTGLLAELLPKGDKKMHLVAFLTAKQAYQENLENSREFAVAYMREYLRGCRGYVKKADIPLIMALVLADDDCCDTLQYPDAAAVRAEAEKLA